jgi:hypothetical protein
MASPRATPPPKRDDLGSLLSRSLVCLTQGAEPPERVWREVRCAVEGVRAWDTVRGWPPVWLGPVWGAGRSRLVWIYGVRFDDVGDVPPRLAWC